jgi:mono/diheme cytochrome c family protein
VTFAECWINGIALSAVAVTLAGGVAALAPAGAHGQDAAPNAEQAPPAFTEEILDDPKNIEVGQAIWQEQCTHCHGAKAYPGKAPKLKPSRYKRDFVWHRVYISSGTGSIRASAACRPGAKSTAARSSSAWSPM